MCEGRADLLALLLEHGADVTSEDKKGDKPPTLRMYDGERKWIW